MKETVKIKMTIDWKLGNKLYIAGKTYDVSEIIYLKLVDKERVAEEVY